MRVLLLVAVLPCIVLADILVSSDDSKQATGVEVLDSVPSASCAARRGIFSKCNFLTCKGKCCDSNFCCPFSGAKCCPDNKCCPKGLQCCPVGCCPKGQDCCGGGCCAAGQRCCGTWCCDKKKQCGATINTCYG